MKSLSILFIFTFLLFIACDEIEPESISVAEQIAGTTNDGQSYMIITAEVDIEDVEGTVELDKCITDNTIIYYPDGRYEENEGRSKCKPSDPPGITGTWKLNEDESKLFISKEGETKEWDIVGVTGTQHKITRPSSQGVVTYVLDRLF